jgi:hypothetical protein
MPDHAQADPETLRDRGARFEDYEVVSERKHVGHIIREAAAIPERPGPGASPTGTTVIQFPPHGYEPRREDVMAAFKKSWLRQWRRTAAKQQLIAIKGAGKLTARQFGADGCVRFLRKCKKS